MAGSRFTAIRQNICNAIVALPGYDQSWPVYPLGIPADAFFLGVPTAIGVCLSKDRWIKPEDDIQMRIDQEAVMDIPIVFLGTSEASPAGALSEDEMIDDMVSTVLGTAMGPRAGPGIRSVDVGIPGECVLYLMAIGSDLIPEKKRAEGSGGALAKVILFRTTSLAL
jgi:hypothetical protein